MKKLFAIMCALSNKGKKVILLPLLLDLFCTFFRIGLFTFGGGYAMLPLLQREFVENKKWAAE